MATLVQRVSALRDADEFFASVRPRAVIVRSRRSSTPAHALAAMTRAGGCPALLPAA
jgi:hypothetical protein